MMKLLELFGIRPPVVTALPAGKYAFLHLFDFEANALQIDGTCQLSDASLQEQLEELSYTLELSAKRPENDDVDALTVSTFLTPFAEDKALYITELGRKSSRKLAYNDGFAADRLINCESWVYLDGTYCGSWLIQLNLYDQNLLRISEPSPAS